MVHSLRLCHRSQYRLGQWNGCQVHGFDDVLCEARSSGCCLFMEATFELKNYPFILKISSCTTFFNILISSPPLVTMLYYPCSDDQYLILLISTIFFTRYHQPILVLPLTGRWYQGTLQIFWTICFLPPTGTWFSWTVVMLWSSWCARNFALPP